MTRVTDRELELQAEIAGLQQQVQFLKTEREILLKGIDRLTPDQLKAWREEYRERAVVRAVLDECERARDEVALLRKENEALGHEAALSVEHERTLMDQLAKAREVLKTMPHDEGCRSSECRRCQILREIGE